MYLQSQSHRLSERPAATWLRFGVWALLALVGLLALTGFGRYSGVIVFSWAVGMVVAAVLILVRRR